MNTQAFLDANNPPKAPRPKLIDKAYVFYITSKKFDESALEEMLSVANEIQQKNYPRWMPIIIVLECECFEDKLTYILVECICNSLVEAGYNIQLKAKPRTDIFTHGIASSPLGLLASGKRKHVEKFGEKFEKEIYGTHYRGILHHDDKITALSVLMGDIATFQIPSGIKEDDRDKLSDVIVELVGNSYEHAHADCLCDIDISTEYTKKGESSQRRYHGINIAIVDFSSKLFGTDLKYKVQNEELPMRYQEVSKALSVHKKYFNAEYTEEDFYNIAAFQHKISGRRDTSAAGGTGLTKLIQSLEEKSDAYMCYFQSGRRQLHFRHDYMHYNNQQWIGFNETNDFLNTPPNFNLFKRSRINIPGTAYNLTFVMEVEKDG